MNNTQDTIRNLIRDKIGQMMGEHYDLLKKIEKVRPFIERKSQLEESFRSLEQSLSLPEGTFIKHNEGRIKSISKPKKQRGPLTDKKPKQAFKDIIKNHFKNSPFTGIELREYAKEQGLRIKPSYSRVLTNLLVKEEFMKRVEPGVFQLNEQKEEGLGERAIDF